METIYHNELDGDNIRLLSLLPGDQNSTIECTLSEATLDKLPQFEAISYVWGSSQEQEGILCDGHVIRVTLNLARVLRHLRSQDKPRLLWADAICINQNNLLERGHQVQRMGDIYAQAERVIVWLGTDMPDNRAKKAMTIIEHVVSGFPRQYRPKSKLNPADLSIDTLAGYMEERGLERPWQTLSSLFSHQLWGRIWCVQEAALAKSTLVLCGDAEIDGLKIGQFANWYSNYRWLGQLRPRDFDEKNLSNAERRFHSLDLSFLEIVHRFRSFEATDPRDKIYGLVGLLQARSPKDIKTIVDYHKSTKEVMFDAIRQIAHSEGNLHFLSYIDSTILEAENGHGELPSWIPRFDKAKWVRGSSLWCPLSSKFAGRIIDLPNLPEVYTPLLHLRGVHFDELLSCPSSGKVVGYQVYKEDFINRYIDKSFRAMDHNGSDYAGALAKLAFTLTAGFLKSGKGTGDWKFFYDIHTVAGHQFVADFLVYVGLIWTINQADFGTAVAQKLSELGITGQYQPYEFLLSVYSSDRLPFETSRGCIGLGPAHARKGDVVTVLDGGKVPYILRPLVDGEYEFVGECFVHGIMDGEVYNMLGENGVEEKEFALR